MHSAEHYCTVGQQLIRAVRGRRSQADLSRRAGYRSNMVQRWESGECTPTAAKFFLLCECQRIDIREAISAFYGRPPDWLEQLGASCRQTVAQLLQDQRGKISLGELTERTGVNRYSLGRWFSGRSEPRLNEFLQVLDACGERLLDFVSRITAPEKLPVLESEWLRLEKARAIAYEQPWSHGILRALELDAYQKSGWKRPGFLSRRLGCDEGTIQRAIEALAESGQIVRSQGRWKPTEIHSVNTGRDVSRARVLKASWAKVAVEKLEAGKPGLFGYSVFAVSHKRLREMRALQLEFVQAMEALATGSPENECVGLFCVQLLDLSIEGKNALNDPHSAPLRRINTP